MNREETRKEILELLARGKITLDEAASLLDQTVPEAVVAKAPALDFDDDKPLKVDIDFDVDVEEVNASKLSGELEIEDIPLPAAKTASREPRWLRIHVADLDSGKSTVKVNVPFGMVKFGLGIAQIFAPKEYTDNIGQIGAMMSEADSGILVDVQDAESNEHVRIYFE